jgi:16S rRNA processing protein RimM
MIRDDVFKIGRLGKTHGVKGELSFHFTDDVFDRVDADYIFIETEGLLVPFFFEEYRFRSDETAIIKLEGIDNADRAATFTGCDVYFPRELADGDDGELTWSEIVGFQILNHEDGQPIGEVTAVDLSTVNTLFEVRTPMGDQRLIPANDDLITLFDREHRTITMQLPEGLLEL